MKIVEYLEMKNSIRKERKKQKKYNNNLLLEIIKKNKEISDLKKIIKEISKELKELQAFEGRDALMQKINDQQMLIEHYHELKRYYRDKIRELNLDIVELKNNK